MSVYLIAQINIHDRTTYAKYASGFMDIFTRYRGRILSVDEAPRVIEGEWRYTRTVLIEFPSEDQALSWYNSREYQDLAQHRFAASDANVVLIQGR